MDYIFAKFRDKKETYSTVVTGRKGRIKKNFHCKRYSIIFNVPSDRTMNRAFSVIVPAP